MKNEEEPQYGRTFEIKAKMERESLNRRNKTTRGEVKEENSFGSTFLDSLASSHGLSNQETQNPGIRRASRRDIENHLKDLNQ